MTRALLPPNHGDQHLPNGSDPIPGLSGGAPDLTGYLHWGTNTDDDHLGLTLDASGGVGDKPITILAGGLSGDIHIEGATGTFLKAMAADEGFTTWHMHANNDVHLDALNAVRVNGIHGITLNPGSSSETINATTHRIVNVADPWAAQDAATKAYVDAATGSAGVPTSRTLTAGAGLTGGGDLSADRTFDVNVDGTSVVIASDAVKVGTIDGGSP